MEYQRVTSSVKNIIQKLRVKTSGQNLPPSGKVPPIEFRPHKQITKDYKIRFYLSFSKISEQRVQNG